MAKEYSYQRVAQKFEYNRLSTNQQEILYLLLDERLTPKQIAKNKGVSHQAVYKTIKKLKDLGIIKQVAYNTFFHTGSSPKKLHSDNNEFRLHGQKLVIKVLSVSEYFIKYLESKNRDLIDNNVVMLNENKITIYANKDFWGNSVNTCVRLSLDYWTRFITKLENRFRINLITHNTSNIKEFGGEIAKVNDIIARKINLEGHKLKVYDNKGRLRLIVDKSFKFNELEAVNKDFYIEDMGKVENFYKDLLKEDTPLVSEVYKLVLGIIDYSKQQNLHHEKMQNENMLVMKALMKKIEELENDKN